MRGASSANGTSPSPMNTPPSALIETVIGSCWFCRAAASVWGSSSGTPAVSSGALIMKMISSTSITSTSGVTLISDRAPLPRRPRRRRPRRPPVAKASLADMLMRSDPLAQAALDGRRQVVGEVLQAPGELARVGRELVVGDIGRDGGDQAHGRGEQGLGDRGGDHRQVGVLLQGD